jgi:hypothetical protein
VRLRFTPKAFNLGSITKLPEFSHHLQLQENLKMVNQYPFKSLS